MDRKALVRQYRETPRPAGVFRVVNTKVGRALLGSSTDLPGMLNRQRSQLESNLHPDKELQRDWKDLGPASFTFDVLDVLKPSDDPSYDPSEDLRALKELWLEKLTAAGVSFYPRSHLA